MYTRRCASWRTSTSPASRSTRRWRDTPGRAIGSSAASSLTVTGPRASVSSMVRRLASASARRAASMALMYRASYVTVKVHSAGGLPEVAVRPEPGDCPLDALVHRGLRQAEFSERLAAVVGLAEVTDLDLGHGGHGMPMSEARGKFVEVRACQRADVRGLEPGPSHAGRVGDQAEVLPDGEVLVAEQVALPDPSPCRRQDVPAGDILHVDDVHPAVHVDGHVARRHLDDELSGGRWPDVVRSDDEGGIDDDDGQSLGAELERLNLGQVLRDG